MRGFKWLANILLSGGAAVHSTGLATGGRGGQEQERELSPSREPVPRQWLGHLALEGEHYVTGLANQSQGHMMLAALSLLSLSRLAPGPARASPVSGHEMHPRDTTCRREPQRDYLLAG